MGQCQAQFSGIVAAMGGPAHPGIPEDPRYAGLPVDWEEDLVGPSRARDVLSSIGWLSHQPGAFQEEVFRRSVAVRYAAGDTIYRLGDPLGGIYGIVSGAVIASVAPARAVPHMVHMVAPGGWIGEGPFLSRQPRRLELRAALDTLAVYLPLEVMDHMSARDPQALRNFVQIMMINLDIVLLAFHDLQDPDEHRRIARALRRIVANESTPIPLAQAALGILANASRKTVNAALQRFEKSGWVKRGYRSIMITNMKRLSQFAESAPE
jgi:CRP/FNR family cyclic AMP-dependent transcriptional regulator